MATDETIAPRQTPSESVSVPSDEHERRLVSELRRLKLEAIIEKAHVAYSQRPPAEEGMRQRVDVWEEILQDVPPDRLNAAYLAAIREHEGNWMLTPQAVLRAYGRLAATGHFKSDETAAKDKKARPANMSREELQSAVAGLLGELKESPEGQSKGLRRTSLRLIRPGTGFDSWTQCLSCGKGYDLARHGRCPICSTEGGAA